MAESEIIHTGIRARARLAGRRRSHLLQRLGVALVGEANVRVGQRAACEHELVRLEIAELKDVEWVLMRAAVLPGEPPTPAALDFDDVVGAVAGGVPLSRDD